VPVWEPSVCCDSVWSNVEAKLHWTCSYYAAWLGHNRKPHSRPAMAVWPQLCCSSHSRMVSLKREGHTQTTEATETCHSTPQDVWKPWSFHTVIMKLSFSLLKAYRLILSASFVAGNKDPSSIFRHTATKNLSHRRDGKRYLKTWQALKQCA